MAAKLKKRALAEYQSQVSVEDGSENKDPSLKGNKKLKLLMPPRLGSPPLTLVHLFNLNSKILFLLCNMNSTLVGYLPNFSQISRKHSILTV